MDFCTLNLNNLVSYVISFYFTRVILILIHMDLWIKPLSARVLDLIHRHMNLFNDFYSNFNKHLVYAKMHFTKHSFQNFLYRPLWNVMKVHKLASHSTLWWHAY